MKNMVFPTHDVSQDPRSLRCDGAYETHLLRHVLVAAKVTSLSCMVVPTHAPPPIQRSHWSPTPAIVPPQSLTHGELRTSIIVDETQKIIKQLNQIATDSQHQNDGDENG